MTAVLGEASLVDGFCATVFASGLERARGLFIDPRDGMALVLERGKSRILGIDDDAQYEIASADDLTHGIALQGIHLYASSTTTVFRWKYEGNGTGAYDREEVVRGIPSGGHSTRTLLIDAGWLYISIGSRTNVDEDSSRSNVRRCQISMLPLDFETECELFADGLRNEVGLAVDAYGTLWGVENGADRLDREDLGGSSASNDNPAEELNRLVLDDDGQPQFYGYPYCFTEYLLDPQYGLGRGTIWAWPGAEENHQFNDERCRTETTPPELAMQAHSAPLGLTFYNFSQVLPGCQGTFPSSYDGDAFVGFHGSWNREEPTGYKVVRIPMNASGPLVADPIDFLRHDGEGARWDSGFRPVDVKFDTCGRLLVTSDGTRSDGEYSEGVVLRISFCLDTYQPTLAPTPIEAEILCIDDQSWYKKRAPSKDCNWVQAHSPRCGVKGEDGTLASYSCPAACGTPCFDSRSWYKNNDPSKDCSWVSTFAEKRCLVKSSDKVLASQACPLACAPSDDTLPPV